MTTPTAHSPSPTKDLPSKPQSQSQSQSQSRSQSRPQSPHQRPRLPIRTYHCTFCKQILLATTRDVARLPRRSRGEGLDSAIIMPLRTTGADTGSRRKSGSKSKQRQRGSKDEDDDEDIDKDGEENDDEGEDGGNEPDADDEEEDGSGHYTILLSTTAAASSASIIRRRDGFEKRLLLRCGRCQVVCGYVLDNVHFPAPADDGLGNGGDEERGREDGGGEAEVVYILPGAVVETGVMMGDTRNKVDMAEWEGWEKFVAASS